MNESTFDTLALHGMVDRWQAGDREAMDQLIRQVGDRLERLARKMLVGYAAVRGTADTFDVLQNSTLRLMNALNAVRPAGTRDFFNLAAVQIRRELIDLGRRGARRRETSFSNDDQSDSAATPILRDGYDADLELWTRFHEVVEELPVEQREVVGLIFYHGWTQPKIAELFGVDVRTVRRWWQLACVDLNRRLNDRLPDLTGA